jgi:FKBP-type peptidyl-prolyl cis-trans isomerase
MAQERIEAQEKSLESYISTRMRADTLLRRSIGDGVNYLYRPGDTTRTRQAGDTITFNYIGRLFSTRNDSIVFDTNIPQLARRMGIDLSDRRLVPLTVAAGSSGLIEGLNKGLMMTHPRDTGEIIFNSDLGFGSSPNGMIPSNSPLIYTVYMLR